MINNNTNSNVNIKTYNPMSKEFQDECNKLGLTGSQLTVLYKREGRYIEKGLYVERKCKHNETETCDRCGISFDKISGYPIREKDNDENFVGWDCRSCWDKYDPKSANNKQKLERDCRNNNLDPNSETGIGYITAILVKKFLGIEDCFDITGNFNYCGYDMIEHEDWGLIDTKGSSLVAIDSNLYHKFNMRRNKKADFFFCIGYDKDRKHVITVFIIPNDEYVSELDTINVSYNGNSKWNIFKESEEEVKKWDDLFHTLKLDNCPVLRKNIV